MKIKCFNCKKETNIRVSKMEITHYKNMITLKDELIINVFYETFCESCGEYVHGVKRKILDYYKILKLIGDKNYD